MNKLIAFGIALAFSAVAANAHAKESVAAAPADTLLQQRGYTEVSEGLFAKVTDEGESYIAQGEKGTAALKDILVDLRAEASSRYSTTKGGEARAVSNYDRLIQDLEPSEPSEMTKASQYYQGDCNGTQTNNPTMFVNAYTSGGTIASAHAQNYDSSINTTNWASAWTVNRDGNVTNEQTSTTYGTTVASANASTSGGRSCEAIAAASIKCPGYKKASLAAFLKSLVFFDCRN